MNLEQILLRYGPPLLATGIGAYIAMRITVSNLNEKVRENRDRIERWRQDHDMLADAVGALRELVTKIDTKMDLLLSDKIRLHDDDDE